MASTNTLIVSLSMNSQEVLDAADFPGASASGDRTLRSSGFNTTDTLNSTSTPALEKTPAIQEVTIGASPTVIDLSAVDVGIGRTLDMTGKKLVAYQFKADATNTGNVTVTADPTNGYDLFGASGLHVFVPGETIGGTIYGAASAKSAVAAADIRINIAGTSGDVIQVGLWFGT